MFLLSQVTPPEPGNETQWILYLLVSAIVAMSGVVTYIWRTLETSKTALVTKIEEESKNYQNRWSECEEKHGETMEGVLSLTERVGHLEGKQETMEILHKQTLDIVKSSLQKKNKEEDT